MNITKIIVYDVGRRRRLCKHRLIVRTNRARKCTDDSVKNCYRSRIHYTKNARKTCRASYINTNDKITGEISNSLYRESIDIRFLLFVDRFYLFIYLIV